MPLMRSLNFKSFTAALSLCGLAGVALAQRADVPYVPTPLKVIEAMLDAGRVTAADYLVDLGSGDGRVVIEAAKQRGARGTGVELDPNLVASATMQAERQGVAAKA